MRGPHNIWRLIRTLATLERTGAIVQVLEAFRAPPRIRAAARVLGWPFKWIGLRGDPALPPLTRALTALGPAYIKFGQVLSTRPDIVGDELATQLKYLQDKLPPFPTAVAKAMIKAELAVPVDEVFSAFSEPVAAASIAQVHKARVAETGEDVAVKVLRPNIERAFRKDLNAFYLAARWIEILAPFSRRLRPMDVIAHFEGVVMGELDLRLECSAASEFGDNTAKDEGLIVPRPFWHLSGRTVMTIGWAEGIGLNETAAMDAVGVNRPAVAARVLTLFLSHALRDGFFHADMHPGNIQVSLDPKTFGRYIALDFGIIGTLTESDKAYLAYNFIAFFQRDYKRVAELHVEAGWVPPDTRVDALESAVRAVCEPQTDRPLKDISFGQVLLRLFQASRRFNVRIQPQLVLLQKTLLNIEGLGRQLDPDLDLYVTAKPFLERWMNDQIGWRGLVQRLKREAPRYAQMLPEMPRLVHQALLQHSQPHESLALQALLVEQRRTNALLQGLLWAVVGFVGGLLVTRVVMPWI